MLMRRVSENCAFIWSFCNLFEELVVTLLTLRMQVECILVYMARNLCLSPVVSNCLQCVQVSFASVHLLVL